MQLKFTFIFVFALTSFPSWAQETREDLDLKYREDQFYLGVTYGLLGNLPDDVSQTGFSGGIITGFIRDFPINIKRTFAIGLGLGYSGSSYNQNLFIPEDNSGNFIALDRNTFNRNRLFTHIVEAPFEIRWRNSSPDDYRFWRVYSGFKVGYIFATSSRFESDTIDGRFNSVDNFNRFQFGATLSVGYNVWNLYVYYGLNSLFDNQTNLNGNSIDINIVNIGLIFYLL